MSGTHFRKGSLLLEKKLPSLVDLVPPLHCLHRHTSPSLTSSLVPSTMGTAHLAQLEDEESNSFLLNQLTRSSEGPKITGPNSNRDITSYAVLPAFVMRGFNWSVKVASVTPTLREFAYNHDTLRFLVGVVYPY